MRPRSRTCVRARFDRGQIPIRVLVARHQRHDDPNAGKRLKQAFKFSDTYSGRGLGSTLFSLPFFLFLFSSLFLFPSPRRVTVWRHGKIRKGILGGRLPSLHDLTRDPSLSLSLSLLPIQSWPGCNDLRNCTLDIDALVQRSQYPRRGYTEQCAHVESYVVVYVFHFFFLSRDASKHFAKRKIVIYWMSKRGRDSIVK